MVKSSFKRWRLCEEALENSLGGVESTIINNDYLISYSEALENSLGGVESYLHSSHLFSSGWRSFREFPRRG